MGVLEPGAYFGNLSVLSNKMEIYTVVATTEVETGLLTKTKINSKTDVELKIRYIGRYLCFML